MRRRRPRCGKEYVGGVNRKLDWTELTDADLFALIDECEWAGIRCLHNAALIRSELEDRTRKLRFEMWGRGELKFRTENRGK